MAGKNKSKDIKDIEVIQPNNTDSTPKTAASNTNSTAVSAASPQSWVWSYFKVVSIISDNNPESEESEGFKCQVHVKDKNEDKLCGKTLQRDPTGSTKSMSEQLRPLHKIYPPNQETTNQLALPSLFKRRRFEQGPVLNGGLLKQAITYLVSEADLPYSIVEHKSFQHLLVLLNPATLNMDFGWKTIAREAFMAITAHGITSDWKILDVIVGMPPVVGRHTGENFGNIFVNYLDDMEISDALICITANNASSNSS
ncbi:hypothetical protein PGTUg99_034542 [Puccinia graminis f. sp. tritici]|uniref:Uncharacterized protein n=1 Tax=Puccinia graminis f. sp. tritici TaxID=56615 RepID=A0A5B0QVT4_PUCGR|nr:hypothetical protein PGTUg99_034542 [Puccinia graminis f. sp. tritici]